MFLRHAAAVPSYVREAFHRKLIGAETSPDVIRVVVKQNNFMPFELVDLLVTFHALERCVHSTEAVSLETSRWLWLLRLTKNLLPTELQRQTASHVTDVVWCLSRLEGSMPLAVKAEVCAMYAAVSAIAAPCLHDFEPRYLSLLAYSFASAAQGNALFLKKIGDASATMLQRMTPRELTNLMWAFATSKVFHRVLLGAADAVQDRCGSCNEQDLSNAVWALAHLQIRHRELYDVVGQAVEARVGQFSLQGLVMTTWSFTVQKTRPRFVPAAMNLIRESQWRLDCRGAALFLWSLAKLRHDEDMFFASAAHRCILPKVKLLQPQDVSNILWSFATVRIEHQTLFEALTSRTLETKQNFSGQALANVAWACAKMQVCDPELLRVAADEAVRRSLKDWTPQSTTLLCWALFRCNVTHEMFTRAAVERLSQQTSNYSDIDLATMAGILQKKESRPEEFERVLKRIAEEVCHRSLPMTAKALLAA